MRWHQWLTNTGKYNGTAMDAILRSLGVDDRILGMRRVPHQAAARLQHRHQIGERVLHALE